MIFILTTSQRQKENQVTTAQPAAEMKDNNDKEQADLIADQSDGIVHVIRPEGSK
jgi:hypothetical protein